MYIEKSNTACALLRGVKPKVQAAAIQKEIVTVQNTQNAYPCFVQIVETRKMRRFFL